MKIADKSQNTDCQTGPLVLTGPRLALVEKGPVFSGHGDKGDFSI
jgi:hypothetical protein